MRYTSAILFLVALASSGCSSLIARCGYYPDDTTTIEKVRQKFGEPTARGIHDRLPYEEFHTRLMIAEPLRGASLGLGFAFTFGLSEVIAFPYELCRTGAHTVLGQDIRFAYDSAGTVTHFCVAGEWWDRRSSEYVPPGQPCADAAASTPPPASTSR